MRESHIRRLPRGRHALPRAEVERVQRDRLMTAMVQVIGEQGYAVTSVADVIKRSGVSRQSFYQLYTSKLDCFIAAFEVASDLLLQVLMETLTEVAAAAADGGAPDVGGQFEKALGAYLDIISVDPGYARLFLVEVYAAGPEAIARRTAAQHRLVAQFADLLQVRTESGRFACQVVVSAISAMVTPLLVADDLDGLRNLRGPLSAHVREMVASGMLA